MPPRIAGQPEAAPSEPRTIPAGAPATAPAQMANRDNLAADSSWPKQADQLESRHS
jgi:hypothetical protein